MDQSAFCTFGLIIQKNTIKKNLFLIQKCKKHLDPLKGEISFLLIFVNDDSNGCTKIF
jgi:hypothetical protein